jgi:hypothetical protein
MRVAPIASGERELCSREPIAGGSGPFEGPDKNVWHTRRPAEAAR